MDAEPNTDSFTVLQAVFEANHLFVPTAGNWEKKELPEWEECGTIEYLSNNRSSRKVTKWGFVSLAFPVLVAIGNNCIF